MDSNDDFNPSFSESDIKTNPISEEASFLAPTDLDSFSQSGLDLEITSSSSQAIQEDNKERIYIFKNSLFKRVFLPLKEGKEEEMQINCTM